MRKYYLILILGFVALQCKPTKNKEKTYYFYNAKVLFEQNVHNNDTMSFLNYSRRIISAPSDTFSLNRSVKVYGLNHYYKFLHYKDTSFIRPKLYLDSIDYYGTEWFRSENNLDKFWKTSDGWLDSLKIYTIEPTEGTDSLIFRRVHRYFHLFGD